MGEVMLTERQKRRILARAERRLRKRRRRALAGERTRPVYTPSLKERACERYGHPEWRPIPEGHECVRCDSLKPTGNGFMDEIAASMRRASRRSKALLEEWLWAPTPLFTKLKKDDHADHVAAHVYHAGNPHPLMGEPRSRAVLTGIGEES